MSDKWEVVELKGHIIDSLILSKVLDEIIARGGSYESEEMRLGRTKDDPSYARLKVSAPDREKLDNILRRINELGAAPVDDREPTFGKAEKDGVFPDNFYSTTNLETEVHMDGRWVGVEDTGMDCGIKVDKDLYRAYATKMKDVKKGELFVVGSHGVRVIVPDKKKSASIFRFMSSRVSSEKPMMAMIKAIAEEMREIKEKKIGKILFVCGPAIVHTGSREALSCLIEKGYVDVLFAGNALAAHDIEASLYGTSLGVSLKEGSYTFEGHNHHLRAINTIRREGSIKNAIDNRVLTNGIMYTCIKTGCDFFLAGSIRDDGPLPEVETDALKAQTIMKEKLKGVTMAVMVSTMLHSIATGNLLPGSVRTVCVDIDHATIVKLADRGTHQATGLVIDAGTFLRELCERLK
jgi:lysine-ketoglutarate reductase/saccharopine dehydrogenase-like protein (TIGR00300 family)